MTDGFGAFALALAVFFVTHSLPAIRPIKRRVIAVMGERVYLTLYSLISLAALAWVVAAALAAPYLALWPYHPWAVWVPTILMAPVCLLFVCGATTPNPLSIGPRAGFDPQRPGIVAVTRHPVLWAFVLWAGSHVVPNGSLAVAAMFAMFAAFGIVGMPLIDARRRREMGRSRWLALSASTSTMPFKAMVLGRSALRWDDIGWSRVLGSVVLYALFVAFHVWVIGLWPLPYI